MEERIAEEAEQDRNYLGVDPELPCVDRFISGTISSQQYQDEDVHAFVRAGLFRSFTARKVLPIHKPRASQQSATHLQALCN